MRLMPLNALTSQRLKKIISWFIFTVGLAIGLHFLGDPLNRPIYAQSVKESTDASPPNSAAVWVQQGRDAYQAGQYTNAIAPLQNAIQTYAERQAPLNRALALSYLALVYQELGDRPQAEATITTSKALIPSSPSSDAERQVQAQVFNTRGELQFTWGQLEEAIASWKTAAQSYEALDDHTGILGVEINQIQALRALGHYRQAERRITALQSQLNNLPESTLTLTAWRSLGNTLAAMGQIQAPSDVAGVAELAKQSTAQLQPNPLPNPSQPDKTPRLTAQTALTKSLEIAQTLDSTSDIAAAYLSLGNVERIGGDRQLNQDFLSQQQSLVQQSTCPAPRIQAWSDRLSQSVNPYQTALNYYDQTLARGGPNVPMDIQVRSRLNSLSLATALAPSTVPDRLDRLASQIQQLPPSRFAAYAQIHFAQMLNCWAIAQASSQIPEPSAFAPSPQTWNSQSMDYLQGAIAMAQDLGDRRAESYAWGHLGRLYTDRVMLGDVSAMAEARTFTNRAMSLAQQLQAPDLAYRWQWQMGRLLKQDGQTDEAIAYYTQAFNTLKQLRSDLTVLDTDIQFSFREQIEPLYREFAALLLRSPDLATVAAKNGTLANNNETAPIENPAYQPSQANLKQAREVLEALQLAELDNFFQDACSDVEPASLDAIIDEQNPNSAVLYSIVLDEDLNAPQATQSLNLILKLPNDTSSGTDAESPEKSRTNLRYYSTQVSDQAIREVVLDFRKQLIRPHTAQSLKRPAQTLYQWLLQPLEPELQAHHIDHIVFVLDGVLRNVPMAALYDGQGFMGDRYAISVSPGLQLLRQDVQARSATQLLAAGLSESRSGFPPLPNVEAELAQIDATIPTSIQLLNQDFTEFQFETALNRNPTSIVHLATHGQFSSQADNTFLLAYDDKIDINELHELLQAQNRRSSNTRQSSTAIDLLVLSACQTASGDERATLGLAGVAVRAGARSTLASLWAVDDQATALLVSEFYRQLYNSGQGLSKVEALRRAQKSVRELEIQGTHPYEHPRYWAAFVLLGHWQ